MFYLLLFIVLIVLSMILAKNIYPEYKGGDVNGVLPDL